MLIVQLYKGMSKKNCPTWTDTAWRKLEDARGANPDSIYRSVEIVDADPMTREALSTWNEVQ